MRDETWINSRDHAIRRVHSKIERIVEIVRGTSNVKLGVLDVASHLPPDLDIVRAMVDRNHVSVVINVFLKKLWVAIIRTETHRSCVVANVNGRNTWNRRDIARVTSAVA